MVGAVIDNSANANLNNVTVQAGAGLNSVGVRTVVETYQNGASWYRIWSDGWVEQGGIIPLQTDGWGTYTFLKAMKDTNYNFTVSIHNDIDRTSNVTWRQICIIDKTATSMKMFHGDIYNKAWRIEGQGA